MSNCYFKAEARRVLARQPALRGDTRGWEQNRRYIRRMLAEAMRLAATGWPQVPAYTGQRAPAKDYASHLRHVSAAALLLACLPAIAREPFRIEATLLIPHAIGKPLTRDLGATVLHADSLADCELVHAPRIAAEKAKQYAADVRRTRGVVVAECKSLGATT